MSANTSPEERATAYSNYKVAYKCVQSHLKATTRTVPGKDGQTSPSQGDKSLTAGDVGPKYDYEWFADRDAWGVVYPAGKQDCYQIMNTMLHLTGLDGKGMLGSLGYKYDANLPGWKNTGKKEDRLRETVLDKIGNVNTLLGNDGKHLLYVKAFTNETFGTCEAQQKMKYDDADSTLKKWADSGKAEGGLTYTKISVVNGTTVTPYIYTYKASNTSAATSTSQVGATYTYRGAIYLGAETAEVFTCADLAKNINSTANALATWNRNHVGEEVGSPTGNESTEETAEEAQSSCTIEGIGWILCPVMTAGASLVDAAYENVLKLLLETPALYQHDPDTGQDSAIYSAWGAMRSIANVAFVIVFLIIIYSQLTSTGVSQYGLKKLVPRLVIAAILVNVSFFICAIAVDLSNIIGGSISGFFDGIGAGLTKPTFTGSAASQWAAEGDGWSGLVVAVLAGGAALAWVGLSVLLPLLLAVIVAIVTVLVVLTVRQALIIVLIVIAPLAFVAYLLPNTEGWYTKWRKLLTTLLLLFPIIGFIVGASGLASQVIMNSAEGNMLIQIVGAAVAIIPLFVTPILMKVTGGVLGRVGAFVNNPNKGPIDRMRRGAEGFRKDRQNVRDMRALQGGRSVPGRGAFTRYKARRGATAAGREAALGRARSEYVSDAIQESASFANSVAGGTSLVGTVFTSAGTDATQRALASAINTTSKLELEEITAAGVVLKNAKLDKMELRALSDGAQVTSKATGMTLSGTGASQKAAVQQVVTSNDVAQISKLWDHAASSEKGSGLRETLADSLASSSSRPGYIGQGALAQLRTDGADSMTKTIESAIAGNAYSPEKIATADKDELALLADTAAKSARVSQADKDRLIANAKEALTDPELSKKISKNIQSVTDISAGSAPSPKDMPT